MPGGLTVKVKITGVRETLRAFQGLPREASTALRDASEKLATTLATRVASAGRAEGGAAGLVAETVKAKRDRVPVVQAGGAKKVGHRRSPAGALVFGAEFGSSYYHQFKPHQGADSYWFFRTVEESQSEIDHAWNKAADEILRAFGGA